MQLQNFYAQDVSGNIVPGAICSLFLPGTTTLATGLVDVNGVPLANPFSANSDGLVQFAAPNGKYDLKIEAGLIVSTLPITFADTYQALIQLGGFLPPSATAPTARVDGTPLQLGDRYMKTPEDIEYIYKTSGWEANNLDGQLLAAAGGSSLVGFGDRTVSDRLLDMPCLEDYGTSAIDGTTDNQDRWVAAAAANQGKEVWVPAKTYPTSAAIPGFHGVRWMGPGIAKRGIRTFAVQAASGVTNRLYVAMSGSGDGLSEDQPIGGLTAAFAALKNYGPTLRGQWYLELAAGMSYAPAQLTHLYSENLLVIRGPSVSPGATPLAQIDGTGFAPGYGLWVGNNFKVWLQDIKSVNAAGTSVASNIVLDNSGYAYLKNVHTDGAPWSGINANIGIRLVVVGGDYRNAMYPIRAYGGSVFTVGSLAERTKISYGTAAGFVAQSSYGHCDYVDFANCSIGIAAELHGHSTNYFNTFTDCNVGWSAAGFSTISTENYTLTNVTQQSRSAAGFSTQDDKPYRYALQFREYVGANGRWGFGYTDWTTPSVDFQFSKGGTTAGFNLSGFNPATVMLESNGNTILGLAAPDASYSAIWFGNSANSRHCELRANLGSITMLFSNVLGYTFNTTRLAPATDNDKTLGLASNRWSVVYAGTGTINTSDARFKKVRGLLSDAEMQAWASVRAKVYQFSDMVNEKGEINARLHIGYIAQEVRDAFISAGLNPADYALWCEDVVTKDEYVKTEVTRQKTEKIVKSQVVIEVIDGIPVQRKVNEIVEIGITEQVGVVDENGSDVLGMDGKRIMHSVPIMETVEVDEIVQVPDGTRLGLRYTECLVLEASYLRTLIANQEERILALETK